jgi:hypothetical protein
MVTAPTDVMIGPDQGETSLIEFGCVRMFNITNGEWNTGARRGRLKRRRVRRIGTDTKQREILSEAVK